MRLKNLDLIVSVLIAAINVGWALLLNRFAFVGIVLALPLVFFLPGYTLTEALFKRSASTRTPLIREPKLRIERPLNTSDRLILSLGLSLAMDVISGFALNILPMGLQSLSWSVLLGFLITIFSLFAAFRRRGMTISSGRLGVTPPQFRITYYEGILFGLALIVVFLSVQYSTINAQQQQQSSSFTQFWMLPSEQLNNNCGLLLGIRSYEATPVTYNVEVTINGSQVAKWSSVVLAPQQEWDQLVLAKPESINSLYIQALLYRADKPKVVYRDVHTTLYVLGGKEDRNVQC